MCHQFVFKGTVTRLCARVASWSLVWGTVFRSRKKISFHRPISVREHRWNNVKGVLDHLWAILAVYLCIFFKVIVLKIGCRRGMVWGEVYEAARDEICFRLEAGLYPKEERKKKTKNHKKISVARDVHESWKKIKRMCVYSSDAAFAQYLLSLLRRRARFPSFLQGHPWRTPPAFVKQVLERL